jgi:hypothetical protein
MAMQYQEEMVLTMLMVQEDKGNCTFKGKWKYRRHEDLC